MPKVFTSEKQIIGENRQVVVGGRFGSVFYDREKLEHRGSLVFRGPNRVPAGLTYRVIEFARQYNVRGTVYDVRMKPPAQVPLWMVSTTLRSYQQEAQDAIFRHQRGVINAPPRSGKTLIAANFFDYANTKALYVAPSVQIVAQTYRVFVKYFGEDLVARLDNEASVKERDISKQIVVATAASAVGLPEEWYADREALVIDEFHHAAAESYHQISAKAVNAYYRIGLTGTHFRSGDDALAMEAVCGACIYKIHVGTLVSGGFIAPPRVVFAPSNARTVRIDDKPKKKSDDDGGDDEHARRKKKMHHARIFKEAYEAGIVKSEERNARIIGIARTLSHENGIPTVILTQRRDHADALGRELPNAVVVKGSENTATFAAIKAFNEGQYDVLVGTSVIGEGVDLPRAAALIYAGAGSATVGMMQSYYRPLTAAPGKEAGLIYDFVDTQHAMLRKHSLARLEFAREQLPGCVVTL